MQATNLYANKRIFIVSFKVLFLVTHRGVACETLSENHSCGLRSFKLRWTCRCPGSDAKGRMSFMWPHLYHLIWVGLSRAHHTTSWSRSAHRAAANLSVSSSNEILSKTGRRWFSDLHHYCQHLEIEYFFVICNYSGPPDSPNVVELLRYGGSGASHLSQPRVKPNFIFVKQKFLNPLRFHFLLSQSKLYSAIANSSKMFCSARSKKSRPFLTWWPALSPKKMVNNTA